LFRKLFLLISSIFLLTSCSQIENKKLKISASTWIGYSPLYYAKEKGWLKPLNIKLLHVTSLSENMYLFEAGNSDAYVGTQYEYSVLSKKDASLMPVILFDRSNGGDIIMSNISINELQNTNEPIDAYLEMDSINNILLKDFIKKYKLDNKKINLINRDQGFIIGIKKEKRKKPTIIVTYTPYNLELEKNGFINIASTRSDLSLLVIDALYTKEITMLKHKKQFIELKKLIDKAIENLKKNPKEFYEIVKPYMLELSYEDFINSLENIEWINKNLSKELKEQLKESQYPMGGLL
jgi:NitT/TauT family transport system substrate-binding protein